MTVVLGPGWPGVLLHEAVGHGLEGDFNRKGTSAFSGRIGERVAAPGVTVVDDGSDRRPPRLAHRSTTKARRPSETVLIEDGILKGYMQDRLNARLMGVAPTGNGRRESYAHAPMPRMTNTFMRGGNDDPAELLAAIKNGIYAKSFGGGQVDIVSGKFVFSCTEAYQVENGKLGAPIKGATLIGDGPTVLTRVDRHRQRHGARRRRRHLRQGRAVRARRRRPADPADRRADGGRHRRLSCSLVAEQVRYWAEIESGLAHATVQLLAGGSILALGDRPCQGRSIAGPAEGEQLSVAKEHASLRASLRHRTAPNRAQSGRGDKRSPPPSLRLRCRRFRAARHPHYPGGC